MNAFGTVGTYIRRIRNAPNEWGRTHFLEKIEIRGNEQSDAYNRENPEQGFFLFHHTQIDEKKTNSIKGMKDKEKEENEIEGLVLVEP
jgi:hypothetical protein